MIDESVFDAELENGHRFVAVAKNLSVESKGFLKPRNWVEVEFSPYDMSKARVVANENDHEGEKLS